MASAPSPHFLTPVLHTPGPWGLQIERTGQWFVRALEMAASSETRRRGLLGRESLPPDAAMVIAPSQGIHTFGMRFTLDVIGVSRDGRVVTCRHDVVRNRLVFAWRAFAILEVAAGVARRADLRVGDRLIARESATR